MTSVTITEVRAMCLWLAKLVPHQQFDDDTPEAWAPILSRIEVADAKVAVMAILTSGRYVAPVDIVQAVRRLRSARLERAGFVGIEPNVDPDDWRAVKAEQVALRDAIASGHYGPLEIAAYEAGGVRLTPGEPHRPAGEVGHRLDLKALKASVRSPSDV